MANELYTGTDKLYEEKDVARMAGRINSYTGLNKAYKLSEMADGVDEAAEAAAEEKEAVTRALIDRSITEIVIPEGVTKIGNYCFIQCFSLKRIKIPNTVTSIGGYALGINNLTSLELPDSVIDIGNCCIYSCTKLESITFGKSLSKIIVNNFNELPNCVLYNFSRCEQVPELGGSPCFRGINPDARILVPASLYDEWVVATNWAEYEEYIIPGGRVPAIATPNYVSEGLIIEDGYLIGRGECTDSVIVVPEEVTEITHECFVGDRWIETLILPEDSGATIAYNAFDGSSLRHIKNVNSVYSFTFNNIENLELVTFVDVNSVGLTHEIAVSTISSAIVYDFTKNTKVPALWNSISDNGGEFNYVPKIYVPAELYDEWINATNWAEISEYIVAAI